MGWPFTDREYAGQTAEAMIGDRVRGRLSRSVSRDRALRISAYWAGLRLRAEMISTMPVDIFRPVDGMPHEVPKPPVFKQPGGAECRWIQFVESTQRDLDSVGNTVGIVTAFDGAGKPARIELQPIDETTILTKGRRITSYKIDGTTYEPARIWHEKSNVVSGSPVGLSPTAYMAMTANNYLSAAEFAAQWFGNNAVPGAHLRNIRKALKPGESEKVKRRFMQAVQAGDVFVSGNDWEYNMLAAKASESAYLEQQDASVQDVCRFLGVPGDMIDVPTQGSSVTYANITQRNLQLLILNLNPAVIRREEAWSYGLLPAPRYAKLNPNALLRMDFRSRLEGYKVAIDGRILAPSEARALEERPPFTPEQEAEFARLFGGKSSAQPKPEDGMMQP